MEEKYCMEDDVKTMDSEEQLEPDISSKTSCCQNRKWKKILLDNLILLLMIVAIFAGVGLGIGMRTLDPPLTPQQQVYLRFPGEILLRMLKCLILPIVVSTIIAGVASLGANSGKIGGAAVAFYVITTVCAVLLGILLVSTIKPGEGMEDLTGHSATMEISNVDSMLDLIRNLLPDNIVSAAFQQTQTTVKTTVKPVNETYNETKTTYDTGSTSGLNILGIIMFSIAFGAAVGSMGEAGEPVKQFFQVTGDASMKLVTLVIWYSPVGIIFLIAKEVVAMTDPVRVLRQLALFIATVLSGLAIQSLVVLPIIYFVFTRRNPLTYARGLSAALVTAFATASSSATLPVTMRCLEENNKVDPRITRFVVPVGATINMDGTALYEAVAGLFIAQLNGIEMDFVKVITTALTATLAAIGAAGIPSAGLVTLIIVITALGLPQDDIAKILAIDWFLDRCRTATNVWGDSIGAGVIERLCRNSLKNPEEENKGAETVSEEDEGVTNPAMSDTDL